MSDRPIRSFCSMALMSVLVAAAPGCGTAVASARRRRGGIERAAAGLHARQDPRPEAGRRLAGLHRLGRGPEVRRRPRSSRAWRCSRPRRRCSRTGSGPTRKRPGSPRSSSPGRAGRRSSRRIASPWPPEPSGALGSARGRQAGAADPSQRDDPDSPGPGTGLDQPARTGREISPWRAGMSSGPSVGVLARSWRAFLDLRPTFALAAAWLTTAGHTMNFREMDAARGWVTAEGYSLHSIYLLTIALTLLAAPDLVPRFGSYGLVGDRPAVAGIRIGHQRDSSSTLPCGFLEIGRVLAGIGSGFVIQNAPRLHPPGRMAHVQWAGIILPAAGPAVIAPASYSYGVASWEGGFLFEGILALVALAVILSIAKPLDPAAGADPFAGLLARGRDRCDRGLVRDALGPAPRLARGTGYLRRPARRPGVAERRALYRLAAPRLADAPRGPAPMPPTGIPTYLSSLPCNTSGLPRAKSEFTQSGKSFLSAGTSWSNSSRVNGPAIVRHGWKASTPVARLARLRNSRRGHRD